MDLELYHQQYQESLQAAADKRADYAKFLDRSRPEDERLEAARDTGGFQSTEALSQSVQIVRDPSEPPQIRALALSKAGSDIAKSPDLIEMVLGLLKDPAGPVEVRRAALNLLRQMRFTSPVLEMKRPEYMDVLRAIIDDADQVLRQQAIEMLAQQKDEYVQRRLLEGLEQPAKALLPPAKAIQMLGYDVHAEYFPILREIVKNAPDAATKQEAVRLLSADPTSVGLLTELYRNRGEHEKVRRASAIALQALAPAQFEQHAKNIVLDPDEEEGLRTTSISALSHFGDHAALQQDHEFNLRLGEMDKASLGRPLQEAVQRYTAKSDQD